MAAWRLTENYQQLLGLFGSLEQVFALQGQRLTKDPLSEVILLERDGVRYYVKRYWGAGKNIRRFLGRPRVKAEWQNLRHFSRWGIPTANVVAYGLERKAGQFVRGALITEGLPNTQDLAALAHSGDPRLQDRQWLAQISEQLALATATMHRHHFVHNDLKWRNLLVNDQAQLFFIDCPGGSFWFGPMLQYRIIKDLACLDKVAKYHLPRTVRLRFFLTYRGHARMTKTDKGMLRRILGFFEGRE
ncbi:lipopolysaccharide kinase InaA family protein [Atopomonas sediminilitoris]|uniref:lipopolysaccharide kinase InaA family protein n=1 Tax=Atopomonas sediminilitoris TaxID=2919919 RepID=UPI001F4DF024|nr:lipopolysaccharide kinase InaA family protein [Atopomonas sediminilitoris]MCJ8170318.1 lipopolysaccharide kinase InaA family protein [Atopomonas sediminilitoris]